MSEAAKTAQRHPPVPDQTRRMEVELPCPTGIQPSHAAARVSAMLIPQGFAVAHIRSTGTIIRCIVPRGAPWWTSALTQTLKTVMKMPLATCPIKSLRREHQIPDQPAVVCDARD